MCLYIGEHYVVGRQALCRREEAQVPHYHPPLIVREPVLLLPELYVLLHRYLVRNPVVCHSCLVVLLAHGYFIGSILFGSTSEAFSICFIFHTYWQASQSRVVDLAGLPNFVTLRSTCCKRALSLFIWQQMVCCLRTPVPALSLLPCPGFRHRRIRCWSAALVFCVAISTVLFSIAVAPIVLR